MRKAIEIVAGMICAVLAAAGVALLAIGFFLAATAIFIMEKVEE